MLLSTEDKSFIWDIVDASTDIINFTETCSFSDFDSNKLIKFAVERQLLVIGEASKRLSEEAKLSFPSIPWHKMIGLRNIIAHEYGEILTERIWLTAKSKIPELYEILLPYSK